jgi:hypothetical protein
LRRRIAVTIPVRIRHAVVAQTPAQILRLPDVEHQPGGILLQLNTRALGHLPEESLAQPLDERPGIGKQQCLGRRHRAVY